MLTAQYEYFTCWFCVIDRDILGMHYREVSTYRGVPRQYWVLFEGRIGCICFYIHKLSWALEHG